MLLRVAIAFMSAAVVAMFVAFIAANTVALYIMLACVAASYLCVYCEDQLYKRQQYKQQVQRIVALQHTLAEEFGSSHSNRHTWM